MATVTIEKEWDGNAGGKEYGNRIYTSNGRWQWLVVVDGEVDSAHDLQRDAKARADEIGQANTAHVRVGTKRAGQRIADSRGSAGDTLCGSQVGAYDVSYRDAMRSNAAERDKWITCKTCRKLIA